MSSISTTEQLRLLNLAYRKMMMDFEAFAEGLFRSNENIASSSGHILLPTYVTEVEFIVTAGSTDTEWEKINKDDMYHATGWYHDGIDTSTGKRRIMVRDSGAAVAATTFTVHYLREYSDLTATTDVPHPFGGKRYLDLLTTLQSHYWQVEQGKEKFEESGMYWDVYSRDLKAARKLFMDDEATYGTTSHGDAGERVSSPYLHDSAS